MASLLVTGGAGFIGANFVRYWRGRHPADAVAVVDALTYAGDRANLDGAQGVEFTHGDIRDEALIERLLRQCGVDTLVNFAAETHVDRSIVDADAFIQANVIGVHGLLKAARRVWLDDGSGRPHRFHHVSTDEVFGSLPPDGAPFCETTPYAPNSPYAASKAASDHFVRAYGQTFGLQTTISNSSNNFGPWQHPEKLIPLCLINALEGRPLPVYGDGLQVRDWLFVEDHCRAIDLILKGGRPGETYNIGGGSELTNLAVIEALCAAVDAAFRARPELAARHPSAPAGQGRPTLSLKSHVADRAGHDRRYAIDGRKIQAELGYSPARSFTDGLADTVGWYLDHEPWWRQILAGVHGDWLDRNYRQRPAVSGV